MDNPSWKPTASRVKAVISIVIIGSLATAYILGFVQRERGMMNLLTAKVPQAERLERISERPLILKDESRGNEAGSGPLFYVLEKAQGWGGPLLAAAVITGDGRIQQIHVIDHKETPTFFSRLRRNEYLQQFVNKKITAPLKPGVDIDTITQATISADAFALAIRRGSRAVAETVFHFEIPEEHRPWSFGWKELVLIMLFAGIWLSISLKSKPLRVFIMAAAFVYLGFFTNFSLSIAHFGGLILGYFPLFREHSFWWLLVAGALLTAFILSKNLYCIGLCPFGSLQDVNAKVSGLNLSLSKYVVRIAKPLSFFLTWLALTVIFLKSNPALGAYEPFPTLFGLEGSGIQWVILSAALVGSFFITRFFCRFFCPVGVILGLIITLRCRLDKTIKSRKPCPD